jgi:hypothetical protein
MFEYGVFSWLACYTFSSAATRFVANFFLLQLVAQPFFLYPAIHVNLLHILAALNRSIVLMCAHGALVNLSLSCL